MMFNEIYVLRLGAGVTVQTACAGFSASGAPLPVLPFGQGPTLRFVLTPQVWAINGDGLSLSFDGRTVDPDNRGDEVSHLVRQGSDVIRFSITRPVPGGIGLDYARTVAIAAPVLGVARDYRCITGIPTRPDELPGLAAATYPRTTLFGSAQRLEGGAAQTDALGEASTLAIAADFAARRVTLSLNLVGTSAGGTPRAIVRVSATAPIDPATGSFTATLTGEDRVVTGSVGGRFFGPAGTEVAAAFDAEIAASATRPATTVAGTLFGAR